MRNIIGLDLGTNSIGWAVIGEDAEKDKHKIKDIGSRIIPMDATQMGDFEKGKSIQTETAQRTIYRSIRRLTERRKLRRERLLRVLHLLNFLPTHYDQAIGWDSSDPKTYGKFKDETEPKLAWQPQEAHKHTFLFHSSFEEMVSLFKEKHPDINTIPLDWTLYYLRKKALQAPISKEELAWILLQFNQKRGYNQARGEEVETKNKLEEYFKLKILQVEETERRTGKKVWYIVHLDNGWSFSYASENKPEWERLTKDYIVTTSLDKEGKPQLDKEGKIKRSFRAPKEEDWTLKKKKTESDIQHSGKMVGTYIFDQLLANPKQKIIGEYVGVIDRTYYKKEIEAILDKQKEYHSELRNAELLETCIKELYKKNTNHQNSLRQQDFKYLLVEDILFYQRPLKSKKSLIADCPYEYHHKCIAKSHPLYQQFRLWQTLSNLRFIEKEHWTNGVLIKATDVTSSFLPNLQARADLFKWLNDKEKIKENTLLKYSGFNLTKNDLSRYSWNYGEEKELPCNETRSAMLKKLEKAGISSTFLTAQNEHALWHILYAVTDKKELTKALTHFTEKHPELQEQGTDFVAQFLTIKPYSSDYGAYSAKVTRRLLHVMNCGDLWDIKDFDAYSVKRIHALLDGEVIENIPQSIYERIQKYKEERGLTTIEKFQGLPTWLACYILYGRHSEEGDTKCWKQPTDIDTYLKKFKQHSLHNPIVEQIITETLRTVRDIWQKHEHIDEIHIELGRDIKNNSAKRKNIADRNNDNENTNMRIKALLLELKKDPHISDIRPHSPSQQTLLRLYEEGALSEMTSTDKDFDFVQKIRKSNTATPSELQRYKLWLDQKYCSPYTGQPIPLSHLFTTDYEIEHVIPKARFFDDSFTNKVICEREINKLKSNLLGLEFITKYQGRNVPLDSGKEVTILSVQTYTNLVEELYVNARTKRKKLLMDEVPDSFIERQMNDSRYISKFVMHLLGKIVREEEEQESTPKNLIPCTGTITTVLKHKWGLNDCWNTLVYPRFERMNRITNSNHFGYWDLKNGHRVFQTDLPLEAQRGFNKKRIDHRHHAMDALTIACANRTHINYFSYQNAKDKKSKDYNTNDSLHTQEVINQLPWPGFKEQALQALQGIIVSFKQNKRVINKTVNNYQHYNEEGKKVLLKQNKGDNWAIRKPLHKETVFGTVNLRRKKTVSLSEAVKQYKDMVDPTLRDAVASILKSGINPNKIAALLRKQKDQWPTYNFAKIEIFYFTDNETNNRLVATRKPVDISFTEKKIRTQITDTGIQKILLAHLANNNNEADQAFSPEGIKKMNDTIKTLNNGKAHQPIYKARIYETLGEKFIVGTKGNRKTKWVEAQKGTNLFFAIYQDEEGKRFYRTIPLNEVIQRQKQGLTSVPEKDDKDHDLLFFLSPNDLVYIPTEEEKDHKEDICLSTPEQRQRIYKVISCTGNRAFFTPASYAHAIIDKELGSLNKTERMSEIYRNQTIYDHTDKPIMIKSVCWKLNVNQLGEIKMY